MSEHEIREMGAEERAEMVTDALTRRSKLRTIPLPEFQAMHAEERKRIQVAVDECNRIIAYVAYVRDTE